MLYFAIMQFILIFIIALILILPKSLKTILPYYLKIWDFSNLDILLQRILWNVLDKYFINLKIYFSVILILI